MALEQLLSFAPEFKPDSTANSPLALSWLTTDLTEHAFCSVDVYYPACPERFIA